MIESVLFVLIALFCFFAVFRFFVLPVDNVKLAWGIKTFVALVAAVFVILVLQLFLG